VRRAGNMSASAPEDGAPGGGLDGLQAALETRRKQLAASWDAAKARGSGVASDERATRRLEAFVEDVILSGALGTAAGAGLALLSHGRFSAGAALGFGAGCGVGAAWARRDQWK
jgi:hypothetical protein